VAVPCIAFCLWVAAPAAAQSLKCSVAGPENVIPEHAPWKTASGAPVELESAAPPSPPLCAPGAVPEIMASGPNVRKKYAGGERCEGGYCYWYATAYIAKKNVGTNYATRVEGPKMSGWADAHSDDQYWISFDNGLRTIEEGWVVEPAVYGNDAPHLFIYFNPDNYEGEDCQINVDGCEYFVAANEATFTPNEELPEGKLIEFGAYYESERWYLTVDARVIGYIPESAYKGHFTYAGEVEYGGEVFDDEDAPTSQMGNGKFGTESGSLGAQVIDLWDSDLEIEAGPAVTLETASNKAIYDSGRLNKSKTEWHFGGPGA